MQFLKRLSIAYRSLSKDSASQISDVFILVVASVLSWYMATNLMSDSSFALSSDSVAVLLGSMVGWVIAKKMVIGYFREAHV